MTQAQIYHILLVEDITVYHELTQEALNALGTGNQLSIVTNGEDALAFIRQNPPFEQASRPDLILLDLHLPQMKGYDLLKILKNDPDWRTIPVIILTGSVAREDVDQCYRLQANCFVHKPGNIDQFVCTISQVVHFWLSVATLPGS